MKEIEPEDLTPRQREVYDAFMALNKETILNWPRKSGKTTLVKLITRKLKELDHAD